MRMRNLFLAAVCSLLFASVADAQCLLTFQTEVIEAFVVGEPKVFLIEGVSGTEPYKFEIIHGDPLPEGFHLARNGRLIGVPTEPLDQTVFITLTDAAGCEITQAFNIVVFEPTP